MDVWTDPEDQLLDAPLDELAMSLLRKTANSSGHSNSHSVLMGLRQNRSLDTFGPLAAAIAEAYHWLSIKGLTAPDPSQSGPNWFRVTRLGHQVLEQGLPYLRAVEKLDFDLTPALQAKVRPMFLRGDFETACFAAMKEVEVEVRRRSGLPETLVGVTLMRQALKDGGPLADKSGHPGEVVAQMEFFAGAIGLFKNPASHRPVDYENAQVASEIILTADLLLRLLARIPETS